MKAKVVCFLGMIFCTSLTAQEYVVPPSSNTRGSVPVISDEAMEQCVKLYNEAKWLADKLGTTVVDSYSQESVDSYNKQIEKHSSMIGAFNKSCAGKQSQSAYDAAQKLNKQAG